MTQHTSRWIDDEEPDAVVGQLLEIVKAASVHQHVARLFDWVFATIATIETVCQSNWQDDILDGRNDGTQLTRTQKVRGDCMQPEFRGPSLF